jgi:hypothetical protein
MAGSGECSYGDSCHYSHADDAQEKAKEYLRNRAEKEKAESSAKSASAPKAKSGAVGIRLATSVFSCLSMWIARLSVSQFTC